MVMEGEYMAIHDINLYRKISKTVQIIGIFFKALDIILIYWENHIQFVIIGSFLVYKN